MDETVGKPQEYAILTQQILGDKNLTCADKFVLARISGFERYWESLESCANFLGISPTQVSASRNKLEKMGYIKCVENTGRGKTYIFLLNRVTESVSQSYKNAKSELQNVKVRVTENGNYNKYNNKIDTKVDNTPYSPPQAGDEVQTKEPQVSSNEDKKETNAPIPVKVVASQPTPRRVSVKKFEKQYPDLVKVRDRAYQYLTVEEIPVTDIKELNRSIIAIAKIFRDTKHPQQHINVLNQYIDFLESDEYYYQRGKNKYCPQITTVADFAGKFNQIRRFKANPEQWYDPSKTLSKD